jgi:hypothetical protein
MSLSEMTQMWSDECDNLEAELEHTQGCYNSDITQLEAICKALEEQLSTTQDAVASAQRQQMQERLRHGIMCGRQLSMQIFKNGRQRR